MSTVVCQNFVSCSEPKLTETATTLKLKVAAGLDFCKNLGTDSPPPEAKATPDFGNWGFLASIPKESGDKESCYSHPLARKSSFSSHSAKSLELCTENLGSETGSDIVSDSFSIFSSPPLFSPSSNSDGNSTAPHNRVELDDWKQDTSSSRNPHHREAVSLREPKNFPPPLTTLRGSGSLQVRRRAEGGRLIIEAVETPFRNSYLQAERSDGRLRLSFLTGADRVDTTSSAGEEQDDPEEEGNGGEWCGETAEEERIEEPGMEVESEKQEFDGEVNLEMGMEKFRQLLRRCKEGRRGSEGLCRNWKPTLWVATS